MREVAKRFGVAQTTLSNRVNGITREQMGRPTTLSDMRPIPKLREHKLKKIKKREPVKKLRQLLLNEIF